MSPPGALPLADRSAAEWQLYAHEQVCAERQGTIMKRVDRIEAIMLTVAGALLLQSLAMGGALIAFLMERT